MTRVTVEDHPDRMLGAAKRCAGQTIGSSASQLLPDSGFFGCRAAADKRLILSVQWPDTRSLREIMDGARTGDEGANRPPWR